MSLVIHKYMVERMPEEELLGTFAARDHTLDYLVGELRGQAHSTTLKSYFVYGPRGAGKTTLVRMLALRLERDEELRSAWIPVVLPEELHGVASLRDVLAAMLRTLAEHGVAGAGGWHARVEAEADDGASRELAVHALRLIAREEDRRFVVFVENLDAIFARGREPGLGRQERASLRSLLMGPSPFMMLVATAVRTFPALEHYDEALFQYFVPVPLDRLDDEQVRQLLFRRAEYDGNAGFADQYRVNQDKIRALTRLTSGNPRLVLMLYEAVTMGAIASVVQALQSLVDSMTPVLKDVLEHQMTGQQARVFDALMRAGGTAQPRDLARPTRLSLNAITMQLKRLKDMQLLELQGGGKGRPAYYSVADRLFGTWYQLRYLRPNRRQIELFVEFLRLWLEEDERCALLRRLSAGTPSSGGLPDAALAAEYIAASLAHTPHAQGAEEAAVRRWLDAGKVDQAALALAEFSGIEAGGDAQYEAGAYACLGEWALSHANLPLAVSTAEKALACNATDWRALRTLGTAHAIGGNHTAAAECFSRVLGCPSLPPDERAAALVARGVAETCLGEQGAAAADFTAAIEMPGISPIVRSSALVGRGCVRVLLDDPDGAVLDLSEALDVPEVPAPDRARALLHRGMARSRRKDTHGAIQDFTGAIDVPNAPAGEVAKALLNRAEARGDLDDLAGAAADFTAVVGLAGASAGDVAKALHNRAVVKLRKGDEAGAMQDLAAAIDLPDAPVGATAEALIRRGILQHERGDIEGAIGDLTTAIKAPGAPPAVVAQALFTRAGFRGMQGDYSGAHRDLTEVVELPGAPASETASALVLRGIGKAAQDDLDGAIADFSAVLALPGAPLDEVATALHYRAVARGQHGDFEGAIEDLSAAIGAPGVSASDVVEMLTHRGEAKAKRGDTEGAIADFTAAICRPDARPTEVLEAFLRRADARKRRGDSDEAVGDLTSAVELQGLSASEKAKALCRRGAMRRQLGDISGAESDLTQASELPGIEADTLGRALIGRGLVKLTRDDPDAARADFDAAIGLPGTLPVTVANGLASRALSLAASGSLREALSDLRASTQVPGVDSHTKCFAIVSALQWLSSAEPDSIGEGVAFARGVLSNLPTEKRVAAVVQILTSLRSPNMRDSWPRICRALCAGQPAEVVEELRFLLPVCEVLETGERSKLDPLPPEQRDLASEILAGFDSQPRAPVEGR